MDNQTKEQRHYNMSRIRNKATKPEETVRKFLFAKGFRYRKNDKRFAGRPDIVLPKYKTIILVNGCFWHMHDCPDFVIPKSNLDYWIPKLQRNKARDTENVNTLKSLGWNVIIIWACELSTIQKREHRLSLLVEEIKRRH